MTKKAKTFYLCLISIALSCILLLFFAMYGHAKPPQINESLTLNATDISLYVNEFKTNFYQVSNSEAKIEFEYDETFVHVDKDKIQGLKAGKSEVVIKASLNDITEQTHFTVTIYNKSYTYEIVIIDSCSFENGCLYKEGEFCLFDINIFDTSGNLVEEPNLVFTSDKDFILTQEFGYYQLKCDSECIIHVSTDFGYEFDINYKIMPSQG